MTEVHNQIYIGGAWVDASTDATFEATNPANGEVLGHVAEGTDRKSVV